MLALVMRGVFAALLLAAAYGPVHAQKAAPKSVVLAPVSSLSVSKPKALVAIEKTIESGLKSVPSVKVTTARAAAAAANRAKRPDLRSCEGEPSCLAELGKLLGKQFVVYAEVGGLGDSQVVYLKVIDVAKKKELRSTLLELSSKKNSKLQSAAAGTRLLSPETYVGALLLTTEVKGAIIYVDGQKRGTTPSKAISASVGSHAIRVTHPEHRDFVRFIDLEFGKNTKISADLKMLPGVSKRLALEGVVGSGAGNSDRYSGATPWYLRWYAITGGLALVGVSSALIFSAFGGDISFEREKQL